MSRKNGVRRVLRGGSFSNGTGGLRTAYRYWGVPEVRHRIIGFRIVVKRRKP